MLRALGWERVRKAVLSRLVLLGVAAALAGAAVGCAGGEEETLVIAVQPTATQATLATQAAELEEFLSTRVGVKVELRFPTTYAGVIEALRFGHAEAAFMSAWPSYLASKLAGADVVLAEVREVVIDQEKRSEPFYPALKLQRPRLKCGL